MDKSSFLKPCALATTRMTETCFHHRRQPPPHQSPNHNHLDACFRRLVGRLHPGRFASPPKRQEVHSEDFRIVRGLILERMREAFPY